MYRQVKDKVIQFSVKWTILLNITLIMYRQVKDKVIKYSYLIQLSEVSYLI